MTRSTLSVTLALHLTMAWTVAAAQEKWSLALAHFNVQYVAGGLKGFPNGTQTDPIFDLDDAQVQDQIVTQSFEPVLDLFLKHPTWKIDLELQAYMVEVMRERHPKVLDKLKQLMKSGQVELVSFHYSDQLFLAYPRRDMEVSHELMEREWKLSGIQPSPVVFCQEGQFGVGMATFAKERGRSVLVLPKNLFKYQHHGSYDSAPPLFDLEGVDVILGGRGVSTSKVEVSWSFFDDGELLATNKLGPYAGTKFERSQAALDEYEKKLLDAEAAGFRIATIGEFVDWAKKNGVQQEPLPPVLDGTWQPPSTDSMHQWMGKSGVLDMLYRCERDNKVLTNNVQARHRIAATETLVKHAEKEGWTEAGTYDERLLGCWRDLLLAQVSDATGINPFINEVRYGLDHAAAGRACAEKIVDEVAVHGGAPYLVVDVAKGAVTTATEAPGDLAEAAPLLGEKDGLSIEAPGRKVTTSWHVDDQDPKLLRLTVETSTPEHSERELTVTFPLRLDGFYLTPGLLEDKAVLSKFSAFELQEVEAGREPFITLPVANGLIGLDKDLWLIKQTSSVHIGATFEPGLGTVKFVDQTLDPKEATSWIFWLYQGPLEKALEHADRINLHPTLSFATGVEPDEGCSCDVGWAAEAGLTGPHALILLMLSWIARRRR